MSFCHFVFLARTASDGLFAYADFVLKTYETCFYCTFCECADRSMYISDQPTLIDSSAIARAAVCVYFTICRQETRKQQQPHWFTSIRVYAILVCSKYKRKPNPINWFYLLCSVHIFYVFITPIIGFDWTLLASFNDHFCHKYVQFIYHSNAIYRCFCLLYSYLNSAVFVFFLCIVIFVSIFSARWNSFPCFHIIYAALERRQRRRPLSLFSFSISGGVLCLFVWIYVQICNTQIRWS